MDSLERRLIELNSEILNTYIAEPVKPKPTTANLTPSVLNLAQNLRTSDSDTIIINTTECSESDNPLEPDCCNYTAIIISEDYTVTGTDYYIGVDSTKPITITLPETLPRPQQIVIKVQMPAPVGNRKVTVVREDLGLLDNQSSRVLQSPFEVIQLFYVNNNWNIISVV